MSGVDLVEVDERRSRLYNCPKSVLQLHHESQVFGPPGDGRLRRLTADPDHWYLFETSGRAIARITPQEWAKALAGI